MGISRLDALTIQGNECEVVVGRGKDQNKFAFCICHNKNHPHHPYMPIFSSNPVYETEIEAKKEANNVIKQIKELTVEQIFA